jgi:hypothetical protein
LTRKKCGALRQKSGEKCQNCAAGRVFLRAAGGTRRLFVGLKPLGYNKNARATAH